MRTPFKVGLVVSVSVFFVTLLFGLFHRDSVNGHVLTPLEEAPQALVLATIGGALALLGAWLGLRRCNPRYLTYRLGLAIFLIYIIATSVANELTSGAPRTVVVPSDEFYIEGLELLAIGVLWGVGAPWLIAVILKRLRLFYATPPAA